MVMVGCAGALDTTLKVGDVVISDQLFQHDVDLRPFRPRFEMGLTGKSLFQSNAFLVKSAMEAARNFIQSPPFEAYGEKLRAFRIENPKVTQGLMTSGDIFFSSFYNDYRHALCKMQPNILTVDMESAAVAQVCEDFAIPFVAIRFISDNADHTAAIDFGQFVTEIAAWYGKGIVAHLLAVLVA